MMSSKMAKSLKHKKSKLADHGNPVVSGRFWTQRIEPRGAALLAQMLGPVYFVVKNHGPDNIMLSAHQGDLKEVPRGAVRATYARGTITVENLGDKSVLIEFEFLPIFIKP
jgi:hypothetical protein